MKNETSDLYREPLGIPKVDFQRSGPQPGEIKCFKSSSVPGTKDLYPARGNQLLESYQPGNLPGTCTHTNRVIPVPGKIEFGIPILQIPGTDGRYPGTIREKNSLLPISAV